MNKQELNKKLAEWAGFKWMPQIDNKDWSEHWLCPDGIVYGKLCPNFPQSLDACFKWLVPKLIQTYPIDAIGMCQGAWYIHLHDTSETRQRDVSSNESYNSDAHSLCLAIEKLIDSET